LIPELMLALRASPAEGLVSKSKSKAATTLPGRVEKVIGPHPQSGEPEKAQISVEGADHLYKEIRVPNRLVDDNGQKVKLKPGAEVDVTIEAEQAKNTVAATDEGS
jgi:hypothetical protein